MGPIRSISGMIDDVRGQTGEIQSLVRRMRDSHRRLTGGTGEAPTQLAQAGSGMTGKPEVPPPNPLLVDLTIAISALDAATVELRAEVNYFEVWAETADAAAPEAKAGYR